MKELISFLAKQHPISKKDEPQSRGSKSEFPNTTLRPKEWRPKKANTLSYHQLQKKSFLDRASNRLARTIAQIRTGHWLCGPYLKRIRKNRDEPGIRSMLVVQAMGMSHTNISLRFMHPKLENARKDIWERPDENGRKGRRPESVGQLLGKSKWEKRLADWIVTTGVGFLGPDIHDLEEEK
jgi:hypothetical protein